VISGFTAICPWVMGLKAWGTQIERCLTPWWTKPVLMIVRLFWCQMIPRGLILKASGQTEDARLPFIGHEMRHVFIQPLESPSFFMPA
jgi:hypothetical protein